MKEIEDAAKEIHGNDGLWRPSLLDPEEVPHPETSGFCILMLRDCLEFNNGILDLTEFVIVLREAWEGLNAT
jgi:unsaturated rhamnogalacturonyl hydrolase